MRIILENGKYEYILKDGKQHILRHGQKWRDETGDNLILAMAHEIQRLKTKNDEMNDLLLVDNDL